jgi:hypothetical protein
MKDASLRILLDLFATTEPIADDDGIFGGTSKTR